jgi:hypothetical protein
MALPRFGKMNDLELLPAFSAGWIISEEGFKRKIYFDF